MAGPSLLGLQHGSGGRGDLGQISGDLVGPMANDDDLALRSQRLGGVQHVPEERPPEQRMQHLRQRRPHALALTGGEYDDGTWLAHLRLPSPARRAVDGLARAVAV